MNNLLLIDNRTNDINVVTSSLTNNTSYVVIDYENETLASLQSKIANLQISAFENVGIFQENYKENTFSFVASFGESILTDVENLDNSLSSWQQFKNLLQHLKNTYGMVNLDLMGCNINSNINWNYVNNKLSTDYSITIRSSNDNTGAESLDGNWILESKNTDLVNLYFTENIKSYNFILGVMSVNNAVIKIDGRVVISGNNVAGQLGVGTTTTSGVPQYMKDTNGISDLSNAVAVSLGSNHTLVLMKDGRVMSCGSNQYGQLGRSTTNTGNFTLLGYMKHLDGITDVSNIVSVYACKFFTALLTKDGYILTCGYNASGQLGIGNTISQYLPSYVKTPYPDTITDLSGVVAISSGENFMAILLNNGKVLGCGSSFNYAYFDITVNYYAPMYVRSGEAFIDVNNTFEIDEYVLFYDFNVDMWVNGYITSYDSITQLYSVQFVNGVGVKTLWDTETFDVPVNLIKKYPLLSGVVGITCGRSSLYMKMNDGRILCRGNNANGQLSINNKITQSTNVYMKDTDGTTDLSGVNQIIAGQNHTVMLMNNNKVLCVGSNQYGQLGYSSTNTGDFTLPVYMRDPSGVNDLSNVSSIYCLDFGTIILLNTGAVLSCGRNSTVALGFTSSSLIQYLTRIAQTTTSSLYQNSVMLADNINEPFIYKSKNPNTLTNFVSLSYPLSESILAGYTLTQLVGLNYATQDLLNAGYIQQDIDNVMLNNAIVSNICFLQDTPINTDQGIILIQNIDPAKNTIRNKKIVAITKTISPDSYLICFEKDSVCKNIPCMKTVISKNHLVFNNGSFIKAKEFVEKYNNVHKIKYNGEILYNVLLEDYDKMVVNNLICETLHPENYVAQIYKYVQNMSQKERQQYIKKTNRKIIDKKIFSNKK